MKDAARDVCVTQLRRARVAFAMYSYASRYKPTYMHIVKHDREREREEDMLERWPHAQNPSGRNNLRA